MDQTSVCVPMAWPPLRPPEPEAVGSNPALPGFFLIAVNQSSVCYRFRFASVIAILINLLHTLTFGMIVSMIISRICT